MGLLEQWKSLFNLEFFGMDIALKRLILSEREINKLKYPHIWVL